MNFPKVSVIIVGYQSRDWLPVCLSSLAKQTYPNLELLFVDNASKDESVEYVRANWPHIDILALESNVGYAAANNLGIKISEGSYVLTLNPDVALAANYVSCLVGELERRPELGGIQGKLFQGTLVAGAMEKSDHLDSTGDIILKDRRVISRGQGEKDLGQYDNLPWVFSLTGAAALWRRAMLEECSYEQTYFDEDFFAYKEDIDLCWRARLAGFEFAYSPAALAWHGRGWGSHGAKPVGRFLQMKKGRAQVNQIVRRHSLKNHYLMMLKNEIALVWLQDLFWIISFELGILLFALLMERQTLLGIHDAWQLRGVMRTKRSQIMARRTVSDGIVHAWFGRRG